MQTTSGRQPRETAARSWARGAHIRDTRPRRMLRPTQRPDAYGVCGVHTHAAGSCIHIDIVLSCDTAAQTAPISERSCQQCLCDSTTGRALSPSARNGHSNGSAENVRLHTTHIQCRDKLKVLERQVAFFDRLTSEYRNLYEDSRSKQQSDRQTIEKLERELNECQKEKNATS
jgi:hypothetical protein